MSSRPMRSAIGTPYSSGLAAPHLWCPISGAHLWCQAFSQLGPGGDDPRAVVRRRARRSLTCFAPATAKVGPALKPPPFCPGRATLARPEPLGRALAGPLNLAGEPSAKWVAPQERQLGERRYADLCLLVRPEMRRHDFFDVLFEFKLVRRTELGKKGQELLGMDEEALRELTPVSSALAGARKQVLAYRDALVKKLGEAQPRCYVVVAVGLERVLGEEAGRPP
jgi:hypothetical protein